MSRDGMCPHEKVPLTDDNRHSHRRDKKYLICIFSYERYPHLRLCLDFLLKSKGINYFDVMVFDDGSSDERIFEFLRNRKVRFMCQKRGLVPSTVQSLASRIGNLRKEAINYFLNSQFDKVVLLDDDILVPATTLLACIDDFEFLESSDWAMPGALTLRANTASHAQFLVGNKTFGRIHHTGEGHVILSKNSLVDVGNKFSGEPLGFGDIQFKALEEKGYHYYCRLSPNYQFQHLGIGEGSYIHRNLKKPPKWARTLYSNSKGLPVQVSGFDVDRYIKIVNKVGGARAPLVYLGLESDKVPTFSDKMEIAGRLEIKARNVKTGERKVLLSEKNLTVTNCRTQISRLVAGDQEIIGVAPTRYISKIGIGTNGTVESVSDISLTNLQSVNISSYEESGPLAVRFYAEFPAASPANGVKYQEAGLLFMYPPDSLATRKVFDPLLKSADWAWEITWELYYV